MVLESGSTDKDPVIATFLGLFGKSGTMIGEAHPPTIKRIINTQIVMLILRKLQREVTLDFLERSWEFMGSRMEQPVD